MKTCKTNKILLFILLLVSASLQSQEKSFEYNFSTDNDEFAIGIREDTIEHVYYITGSTQKFSSIHRSALYIKLSDSGDLISSNILDDSTQNYVMYDILDGFIDSVVFFGDKSDTGSTYGDNTNMSLVFHINDRYLNPVDTLFFPLPKEYSDFQSFIRRLSNGKYIALGCVVDTIGSPTPAFFLYEFSSELDSLHFVFWPDSAGCGQDIRLMEDGNYWAIINGFGSFSPYYYVLDSAYNILSKEIVPKYLSDPFGVKWDSDTTFYIIGEGGGDNDNDIGIMRQLRTDYNDPDKNIFSSWGTIDTLDFPAIRGGLDFNNKDSIFIGGTALWWGFFLETSNWFFILQTDSLLNIRWERFYGGDAYYVMWKLIATADGGCIAAGSRYDYLNTDKKQRDIYVLKLNKEGMLVGNVEAPSIQMHEAIVFPNPGTNELKVRIAAQYPNSNFELYNMAGHRVIAQNIIGKWGEVNTSFLPDGAYIYRIFNADGLFETGKWVKQ